MSQSFEQLNKKYQVIIVGAGPAGLCMALSLYKDNIKNICVIEINSKNHHKPCAGLLTPKANDNFKKLGIDVLNDLNYYKVKNISVFNDNKKVFKIKYKNEEDFSFLSSSKPDRKTLDMHMREKCEQLGIKIFYDTKIEDLNIKEKLLKTNIANFKYDNLVFADGTNGYSKRFNKIKSKNISIESISKYKSKDNFVNLYFGVVNQGYAWIGSTGTFLNVGFTAIYDKNENYINKLIEFAKQNGYEIKDKDIIGAFFPNAINKNICFNDIYIIGDAAGLTDPLTAEGLYYSSLTAMLVSKAIKNNNYKIYLKGIKQCKRIFKFNKTIKKPFYNKFIRQIFFNNFCRRYPKFTSFMFHNYILKGSINSIKDAYYEYIKQEDNY